MRCRNEPLRRCGNRNVPVCPSSPPPNRALKLTACQMLRHVELERSVEEVSECYRKASQSVITSPRARNSRHVDTRCPETQFPCRSPSFAAVHLMSRQSTILIQQRAISSVLPATEAAVLFHACPPSESGSSRALFRKSTSANHWAQSATLPDEGGSIMSGL